MSAQRCSSLLAMVLAEIIQLIVHKRIISEESGGSLCLIPYTNLALQGMEEDFQHILQLMQTEFNNERDYIVSSHTRHKQVPLSYCDYNNQCTEISISFGSVSLLIKEFEL